MGRQRLDEPGNVYSAQRRRRARAEVPAAQRPAHPATCELPHALRRKAARQLGHGRVRDAELRSKPEQRVKRRAVPLATLYAVQRRVADACPFGRGAERQLLLLARIAQRRPERPFCHHSCSSTHTTIMEPLLHHVKTILFHVAQQKQSSR